MKTWRKTFYKSGEERSAGSAWTDSVAFKGGGMEDVVECHSVEQKSVCLCSRQGLWIEWGGGGGVVVVMVDMSIHETNA